MNSYVGILALVVVLLVGVNSRHVDNDYEDVSEAEHTQSLNRVRDSLSQTRHKRRPRQMYPYDYPPPSYYPDYRRDYNYQQEDLSRIIKSLDEIISYMRRAPPPPPPHPVYIPYPVVQYIPLGCVSNMSQNKSETVSLPPRININQIDSNRLWGQDMDPVPEEFAGDGSRPISFTPVLPSRDIKPAPPVDHGTQQVGGDQTTTAPVFTNLTEKPPGRCEAAIITCCSEKDEPARKTCFMKYKCTKTYATNQACEPAVIDRVLKHFQMAYAPDSNE